jgi:hypothetical protein
MVLNIKLGSLLAALSSTEVIEFEKFVASPFFYNGVQYGNLGALLRYILEKMEVIDTNEASFDRTAAFAVTYPDQYYSDGKLEKSLSGLHLLLKKYIIFCQQEINGYEFEGMLYQMAFYRERQLKARFENQQEQMYKHDDLTDVVKEFSLRRRFLLDYETYNFDLTYNAKKSYNKIPQVLEGLEASHLLSKLELLNQYLLARHITKFDLPEEIKEVVEGYFSGKIIQKHPILLLSYKVFQLLKHDVPPLSEFENLHIMINQYQSNLDIYYIRMFCTYMRNLCTILVYDNQPEYLPILFELSKTHYERGYLYYDGKIHGSTLISISQTALLVYQLKWAATFIDAHENLILNDTPKKDYFNLAKANLLFYQKKFDDALSLIPDTMNTIDFSMLCRRLEMKCFYEIQSNILDYKIDTFRMFLSRTGKEILPAIQKNRNGNFANLLARIVTTPKGDKKRVQKLLKSIEDEKELVEREWLISVILRLQ